MHDFKPNFGFIAGNAQPGFVQHDQAHKEQAQDTGEICPVKPA
jgi:hypothetical protein